MEEKNIIKLKKEEFSIREYIKNSLGRGKVSKVRIEYTPVGEKIIVSTHKSGLVIGRGGERISELTRTLKERFKLENPRVEVEEVLKPEFDAQINADDIALSLERFGPLKFKVVAYRTLQKIMNAGALGVEIRLSGKLPGSRAKHWRFAQGYLKRTGESSKLVDHAQARAETKPGTVGVKISILSPDVILADRIDLNEEAIGKMKKNQLDSENEVEETKEYKKTSKKIKKSSKKVKKTLKNEEKKEKKISNEDVTGVTGETVKEDNQK